jgi:hypothetical protein
MKTVVSAVTRGIAWPIDGKIGSSRSSMPSMRTRRFSRDVSPPVIEETIEMLRSMRSLPPSPRVAAAALAWCVSMASSSQAMCSLVTASRAAMVTSAPFASSWSHLVSTGSTVACGAPSSIKSSHRPTSAEASLDPSAAG